MLACLRRIALPAVLLTALMIGGCTEESDLTAPPLDPPGPALGWKTPTKTIGKWQVEP